MRRKKKVTQKDLAKQLGVSEYTVSKALRGLSGMSEDTRNEIIQLARELGYRTKDQERGLLAQRISPYAGQHKRILLILNLHSLINTKLVSSIQETIERFGGSLEIILCPKTADEQVFNKWVEENNVKFADGLIINPLIPEAIGQKLIELPTPKILIGYPYLPVVDSIIWDVYSPVYQSTKQLINAGHKQIMYIGNITEERGYKIRWQAFCDAMKEADINVNKEHHFFHNMANEEGLTNELSNMIERYSPTAIVSNTSVHWLYHICHKLNKKIPQDISLINCYLSDHPQFPNLTCHLFKIREVGERAAERILWRIANPQAPYEHVRIHGTLSEGTTVILNK